MQAVIMAGGKGTRLLELTGDEIPKPLVPVCGKPILQWQIENLQKNGITDICIVTGHLGEKIRSCFQDGTELGVSIQYYQESQPMGTAGALSCLDFFLKEQDFLLVFGDTIFDIDLSRMIAFHTSNHALASLFVHPNSHPFDSDLVVMDDDCRIVAIHSKNSVREDWHDNMVNAGLYILSAKLCNDIPESSKIDLEKDILLKKISKGAKILGYTSSEYIKDVGTPERIKQAENDIRQGVVAAKNLANRQKCIFLDRDGTINAHNGLIDTPDALELLPDAAMAIGLINKSQYLAIVVSNQPVIARGLCGFPDLHKIHCKLKTLLGQGGAYLDDLLFCPHHPDKGYPEENPDYKMDCDCRKPKIGMIENAAKRYHIDLASSWMIGDTLRDIQTGINAGMRTILVLTGEAGTDTGFTCKPDYICNTLLEAIHYILKRG